MRTSFAIIALVACAAAACDTPHQQQAVAATSAAAKGAISVPNDGLIPGTPDGDLDAWVEEIRDGIRKVPDLAETDPAAAQKIALDLYVTRQEYSEMYYGLEGRIKPSEELAEAIETAEERFHELMKLLSSKTPDLAAVKTATKALDKQQAQVAKLWKATGAHLQRPQ